MRTTVRVFGGTAAAMGLTAIVYWFIAYEVTGTVLLSFSAAFGAIVAIWMHGKRPDDAARPAADDVDADPAALAGELLGSFTLASAWPLVLTLGLVLMGAGLIYGLILLPLGGVIATLAVVGLIRQSTP